MANANSTGRKAVRPAPAKAQPQRLDVSPNVTIRHADGAAERMRAISVMVSMLLIAGEDGVLGMTEGERYTYLNHIRDLADEATEAVAKVRYVVWHGFSAAQQAEVANG